jgi:hypothetical protein
MYTRIHTLQYSSFCKLTNEVAHARRSASFPPNPQCAVSGGSLRTCVAANDLEPECVNLRHMLYQVMPCPPPPPPSPTLMVSIAVPAHAAGHAVEIQGQPLGHQR